MRVFLIRHGETYGNLNPTRPSTLTEKGKKQISKIAEGLVNIKLDVIYSSSSERALDTAKVINKKFKTKLIIDDVFSEIYGAIVGGPPKETRPGRFEEDLARAEKAWEEIVNWDYNNVVVVTHGNLIRFLVSKAEKKDSKKYWSEDFDCASITILDVEDGVVKIVGKNKTEHLNKKLLSKSKHNVGFIFNTTVACCGDKKHKY